METKIYKHKKTGEIATYKDGVLTSNNCSIEIGVEPSLEYWDEVIKQCIYVTVDNVEIFGGESIYGVTDDFQLTYTSIATKENVKEVRVFSTKEAAEKYIRENNPQYSLNEMLLVAKHWAYIKGNVTYESVLKTLEKNGRNLE